MTNEQAANVFNRDLQAFVQNKMPEEIAEVTRVVCLELFIRLVLKTPVDTGRARGGWQVDINREPNENIPPDKSGLRRINAAEARIKRVTARNVLDSFVAITNNVEYFVYLDKGTSRQAPLEIVSTTLNEVRGAF